MEKILLDVHTHTLVSGHAYSTMSEMAKAAAEKGLQYLGITEHGPSVPGTCDPLYFHNMFVVPREMHGVRLLLGAELNILDTEGHIDLEERHYPNLDIIIAGIHPICFKAGDIDANTNGVIGAISNPWVHIISHPGDGSAPLEFEPIVLAAKEHHTLLEINNHSLHPHRKKAAARGNNLEILRLCKKHDVPVILGSDAHECSSIANYERLYPLLEETSFPSELIMNDKPEKFFEYTGIKWGAKE